MGVFNNATGELCLASSPDRTSPVATSTDITRLTVSHLHIQNQCPVPLISSITSSQFFFFLSVSFHYLFLSRLPCLKHWLLSVSHHIVYKACPKTWMCKSKRWRQVSQLEPRSGEQQASSVTCLAPTIQVGL